MFALYVTHPQVTIDPAVPVPLWGLSAAGAERARIAATRPWARRLRRIVASEEAKARETAAILAEAAGLSVEVRPGFHENDRSATGYLPPDRFEAVADAFFAAPDRSVLGWETARAAQGRILRAVEAALAGHPPEQPVAFVGHGAVGTLLMLALAGRPIARAADQPPGGGHLFAFDLHDRHPLCGWTAFEAWSGLAERNGNG